MNTSVPYWLGVLQSDGKAIFYNHNVRGKQRRVFEIGVIVSKKSLPMLQEFQMLSKEVLNKDLKIYHLSNGRYEIHTTGQTAINALKNLDVSLTDPHIPPKWVFESIDVFGMYLAGLIDGDGDIRIKRPAYPQCVIRISSGNVPPRLVEGIEKLLNCKVTISKRKRTTKIGERAIKGEWVEIEFYVSKKNSKTIKKYVLPYIKLDHKKERLSKGIDLSLGSVDRNGTMV